MRELSEENDHLSRLLEKSERSHDASRLREARLMDTVEDLTRQVEVSSRETDELTSRIDALHAETNDASIRYDMLRRDHKEMWRDGWNTRERSRRRDGGGTTRWSRNRY